ncbi:hypothetical protein [Burkholderia sp. PAMC 26561]|uniref:hypothetical protein n=1 Tax=Burkholderia sp. PAMC 26561 TaxID=1795043 RepID=UPI00076B3626|nr:hypothetical protein [Burkholderia sp. PAMC 26561]AME26302.1 hypothetical protein AXG89_20655 [Burkholderia sp. PAMC 26561]
MQNVALDTTIFVASKRQGGWFQNPQSVDIDLFHKQSSKFSVLLFHLAATNEYRTETMLDEFSRSGRWANLSKQEYDQLLTLNEQIEQAERWLYRRSRDMVTAYSLAAAQARHADNGNLDEDVNLIATLLFLVREDHPAFLLGQDNILARMDIPILPATGSDENSLYAGFSAVSDSAQRRSEWNPLLLNLYERVLQRDTVKLLSIGALCIDVALIEQQLRSW